MSDDFMMGLVIAGGCFIAWLAMQAFLAPFHEVGWIHP